MKQTDLVYWSSFNSPVNNNNRAVSVSIATLVHLHEKVI